VTRLRGRVRVELWRTAALALSALWLTQPEARLEIALKDADVHIVGWADDRVRVSPLEAGDTESARAVTVTTDAEGVTRIVAVPSTPTRPRVRIEAPASRALSLTLDTGLARVEAMTGRVTVRVVRGAIETRALAGRARLELDTGPIRADAVRLAEGHSLKCRTFNGDVSVTLAAAPTDARILALTLNGAVRSSLPLTTRAAFGPRFGEATIGAGEHVLSIDVVRGDIAIGLAETRPFDPLFKRRARASLSQAAGMAFRYVE
jgi:hypothetical protein